MFLSFGSRDMFAQYKLKVWKFEKIFDISLGGSRADKIHFCINAQGLIELCFWQQLYQKRALQTPDLFEKINTIQHNQSSWW